MALFSGRVHNVLYEDAESAFYIIRLTLDGKISTDPEYRVVVRGYIPGMVIKVGSWVGFEADWNTHKEYGKQLAITKAPVLAQGWDADTAEKVLSSNGVSEQILKNLRLRSGGDSHFVSLLGDPEAMGVIPGINAFTAKYIAQRWQSAQTYFKALGFLNDLGLPSGKIREIWSTFGDNAEKILSSNPWALVKVDGISFLQADEIAARMGLKTDSTNRVRGALLYVIKEQRNNGHMYLTTGQLFVGFQSLLPNATKESFAQVLTECHRSRDLILDRKTRLGVTAVYEPWIYDLEKESAEILKSRQVSASFGKKNLSLSSYIQRLAAVGVNTARTASKKRSKLETVVQTAIEEWGVQENLIFSENQKIGVRNALTQPISILTGLPGSGKTTSLRAVVRILHSSGIRFLLCAPTGIAAKNLSAVAGAPAYTIHRAFCAKGSGTEKREFTYEGFTGESESRSSAAS
ncbi:MAG: helix-hairpin-helix domain-containing protein, partial [Bacteroidota bacterium]